MASTTVFSGGPIVTVDPARPTAEAVAVREARILAVGDRDDVARAAGPGAEVVDLDGRALVPAFVEAHGHPVLSALTLAPPSIDVRPFTVPTGAQVADHVRAAAAATAPGTPLALFGIDPVLQADLTKPTVAWLDELSPVHPVVLIANSAHAAYGNTAAFELAGITARTVAPVGSEIVHDAAGALTGEVREAGAVFALASHALDRSAAGLVDALRWTYERLASVGIATVGELALDPRSSALLTRLADEDGCACRVRAYEIGTPDHAADPANVPTALADGATRFAKIGMKLWADGSPWQGNIATSFPYLDSDTTRRMGLEPCHRGGMNYTPEQIADLADAFFAQGWQLACHVHGDLAVDAVLDAFERARRRDPGGDRRLRLEHCGAMRPEQFARAASLGATVSFFVAHLYHWGDVLIDELFGGEHGARWMSTRSALDAGVRISMHNDGPVTPADPLGNIATAVTRRTKGTGRVLAPAQRLTVDEALRAQTIDAAWQLYVDDSTGSIEPGKSADFVVLSADPRAVAPDAIRELTVEATYFEGRVTYGG